MKNTIICAIVMAGLFVNTTSSFAQQQRGNRVLFKSLPEAVKATARDQRDGKEIKRIEKITQGNQTLYKVTVNQKGADKVVFIAEDGSLRKDASLITSSSTSSSNSEATLNELPNAVQNAFRQRVKNGTVSDVDMHTRGGKTIYEIEYTQAGKASELYLNEDGSTANERSIRGNRRALNEDIDSNETVSQDANAAGFDRPLAATRKVQFEDLPQAVKTSVREQAGSNRIEDVERGTLDGRVIYEVAFKKDGQHNEVRIDEDGSVVRGVAGTEIRFPGALTEDQVPAPVRRAIRDQVGSGEVNDIDKMTVDGKTVYEVGFKRQKGGAQQEVQIAEDGRIIREAAGSEK